MPFVRNISDPQIIKDMLAKTQGNPVAQAEILAKSFNIPQSSFNALFTTDELEATREIQDVEWGNEVTIGSDFSEVEDLTAISIMWRSGNKLRTRNFAFLPENTFENKTSKAQRLMYVRLINEGSLILTKGSAIDQDEVYKWLDDYIQENRLMPIGFGGDAFFSKAYQRRVTQDYGEGMYTKIRQNVMSLSQPLKTVKARIAGGDFQSDDDLLLWALNNLRVKIDANNNIYPNKQKAVDKIDPVLATIQAYYVWELQDEDTGIAW
ncbi:terminase large subunit [Leuconostoc phage CHB]|uniref:Terminase large subunit n=1 Tax=Leuconostoc phage CHB TaxID=1897737 RepID=A0A219VHL4_9CAUD|nr:terminase large subunit [Leuconostoc phage CHB]